MKTKDLLTQLLAADSIVHGSGYGRVTYREWCDRECARMNSHGDGVKILELNDGRIALYRDGGK